MMVGGVMFGYCFMGSVNNLIILIMIMVMDIIVDRIGCLMKVCKFIIFLLVICLISGY